MSDTVKSLLSLTPDILALLPAYLTNFEDYLSLFSTCRLLHNLIANPKPEALLQLCYASRRTSFRPDPLFLLAALSPAISTFAHTSEPNRVAVKKAIWGGNHSLLAFAVATPEIAELAEWSMGRVRQLWEWRLRVVNPVTDVIDKCVGEQWSKDRDDFWSSTGEDAHSLVSTPSDTFFELVIYGEMFGEGMREWLERNAEGDAPTGVKEDTRPYTKDPRVHPADSVSLRLDLVKYCIKDWHTTSSRPRLRQIPSSYPPSPTDYFADQEPDDLFHPLAKVQRSFGEYAGTQEETYGQGKEDQTVLLHLLGRSLLWNGLWMYVRYAAAGDDLATVSWDEDDEVHPEQEIWESCAYTMGMEGMEMLATVWAACCRRDKEKGLGVEWYRTIVLNIDGDWVHGEIDTSGAGWEKLRKCKVYIEQSVDPDHEPRRVNFRASYPSTYEFPFLLGDLLLASQASG